jgi:catalase
MLSDFVL